MQDTLKTHSQLLTKLDNQRTLWLRISGFIAVSILIIIYDWNVIYRLNLSIFVVSIGLITAVAWWYWTMSIIRKLIAARMTEAELLASLTTDVEELKSLIKTPQYNIDK